MGVALVPEGAADSRPSSEPATAITPSALAAPAASDGADHFGRADGQAPASPSARSPLHTTSARLQKDVQKLQDTNHITAAVDATEAQDYVEQAEQLAGLAGNQQPLSLDDLIRDTPFLDLDSPVTGYECFKMIILLPWTLVRFALLGLSIVPLWVVVRVLIIGLDPGQPFGRKRAALVRYLLRFWSHVLLKIFYHFWYIKVKGRENLPRRGSGERSVIVINHVTYMDPIVMVALFAPSAVAKAGVAKIPFFGAFAVALQAVFIERKGFDVANSKTVRKGGAQLLAERAADERFPMVMVAPEGTTKPKHCLLRFSTGAFVAGQPVTPIVLNYTHNKRFNPGWGLAGATWHMWRTMHQFTNHLEVEVLPTYHPSAAEKSDARLYAANVRACMAKALGCPQVDAGVAELVCLYDAKVDMHWLGKKVLKPGNAADAPAVVKQRVDQGAGSVGGVHRNGAVSATAHATGEAPAVDPAVGKPASEGVVLELELQHQQHQQHGNGGSHDAVGLANGRIPEQPGSPFSMV